MELININGKKIIEILNSIEDDNTNDTSYKFEYIEQYIDNQRLTLNFMIISNIIDVTHNTIYINADGNVECYLQKIFDIGSTFCDIESIVKMYLKKNQVDLKNIKNNTLDKYYTIKQLIEMLSLSKSQIYKLLKNKSGIIDKGVKKYNEDVLLSLIARKRK
jgi:hypothetical protein